MLFARNARTVDAYMGNETTHAVTSRTWDHHFASAASANPALRFVKPAWLEACHREQRAVDSQRFEIRQVS